MENRIALDGEFSVNEVRDVRRFVEGLHRREHPELVARVAVATHELFENAVKFSADGTCSFRLDVAAAGYILITTRNRASVDDLLELRDFASRLARAKDRVAFYLELMQSSPKERIGGLGIGRIAAEGEAHIELSFEGDVVVTRAILPASHG